MDNNIAVELKRLVARIASEMGIGTWVLLGIFVLIGVQDYMLAMLIATLQHWVK